MLKKQRYEVPTTDVLSIAIEKNIMYTSGFNEDGNEIPNDDILDPSFFEVF